MKTLPILLTLKPFTLKNLESNVMSRLYKYELKKLLKNKVLLITAAIMFAGIIAWGLWNGLAKAPEEIDGERYSRYTYNQLRQENSFKIKGQVIDDTLLAKMKEHEKGTQSFLPYHDIYNFVGFTIDTMSSVQIREITEERLRTTLSERLNVHLDGYSSAEQNYWNEQSREITSKPISYGGYYDGWNQITSMIKVLVYMVVLFIAVALSTIFTTESTRKTDQLIFASKNGKHRLYWAKLFAGMTLSVIFTILLITVFLCVISILYSFDGYDVMLQFVLMRPFDLSVGDASIILLGLLIISSFLVSVFTMVLSGITKNSIATLSIVTGMLMLSLFISEVPGNIRWLSELWYAIPSNLVNLNGAFRYTVVSAFGHNFTTYQYAPAVLILITLVLIALGRWVYGKYQINAH
jgi:ABC-type transport system involved in multi-copper enzyme maturation permease subunit